MRYIDQGVYSKISLSIQNDLAERAISLLDSLVENIDYTFEEKLIYWEGLCQGIDYVDTDNSTGLYSTGIFLIKKEHGRFEQ